LALTWNGKGFDWVNVVYFSAIHVAALAALPAFTWGGLAALLVLNFVAGSLGIGVTFHRLLTHRGYRVPKPIEYLGTLCGLLASEGGAITWVAMHRYHHLYSDRPQQDLHTPKDGFWWSHLGWIVCDLGVDRRAFERRWAPELVADPVHRVLNPLHATWFVNSAAHIWGYRTFSTPEGSTNCWWVGLIAWGEGWHNNHHAFQRSARHGHAWWELDVNWIVIRSLAALGLASDIQTLPASAERFRIRPEVEQAA